MTVIPRPAATLILLRHEPDGASPQVLMITRNAKTAFAGGALVFPGGSVDEADHELAGDIAGAHPHLTVGELTLRIAAIRETFEESGVLLARSGDGAPVEPGRVAAFAAACRSEDGQSFRTVFDDGDLLPAVDSLVPFARWITPPIRPKRFDTHFFIAAAPAGQSLAHDGAEAVDSVWIEPRAAIDGAAGGRFKLVFATRMNLDRIGTAASVERAMAQARATPVVPIMPEYVETPEGTVIRIPADAGYGGSSFPAIDPPSM